MAFVILCAVVDTFGRVFARLLFGTRPIVSLAIFVDKTR